MSDRRLLYLDRPSVGITFHTVDVKICPDESQLWTLPVQIRDGDHLMFEPQLGYPDFSFTMQDRRPKPDGDLYRVLFNYHPGDAFLTERFDKWSWSKPVIVPVSDVDARFNEIGSSAPTSRMPMHAESDNQLKSNDLVAEQPPTLPTSGPFESKPKPTSGNTVHRYLSQDAADDTVVWWLTEAFDEAQATVKKAREYGSDELIYAGRVMAQIHGQHDSNLTDAQAAEIQIFHYVLGKVGRWVAAMRRGEFVSDDTLLDIGVYTRMVQRLRETGQWP